MRAIVTDLLSRWQRAHPQAEELVFRARPARAVLDAMSVEVIHEAFRTAISDVGNGVETLTEARDDADARVTGFLRAGWTGVAADSFVDAWDEWKLAARDVLDGLVAMQQ